MNYMILQITMSKRIKKGEKKGEGEGEKGREKEGGERGERINV